MSRIAESFRALLGDRATKPVLVRGVRSSARLVKEARALTVALQRLLAARSDVALVSEQVWSEQRETSEVAMLVGSVAYLSGGLVLRLQLLDGRNFRVLDEVEATLGEDLAQASGRLANAVAALFSSGGDARSVRSCML